MLRLALRQLLPLALLAACSNWPGLGGNNDGGLSTGAGSRIEDTSGRLGSACGSGVSCYPGLTCDPSEPGGLCTRACSTDADCGGAVCVVTDAGLACFKTCLDDRSCRSSYSCQSNGMASYCGPGGASPFIDAGGD